MAKKEIKITFKEELIREPVIYQIGHKFKIKTNIKAANVTANSGWVVLEIEGELEEIEQVIESLRAKGIKVEREEKGNT